MKFQDLFRMIVSVSPGLVNKMFYAS